MSVGAGIFAGAALLAGVALYIVTRDRWNWRKVVLRSIFIFVALSAVTGLGIWGWSAYTERPKLQQTFWDIAIGDAINDVRFKKGLPHKTDADKNTESTYTYEPDDQTAVMVRFRDNKVQAVYAIGGEKSFGMYLQGIYFGQTAEALVEKFGSGATIASSPDGIRRTYAFPEYRVIFGLTKNKVELMGVYDTAYPVPIAPKPEQDSKK